MTKTVRKSILDPLYAKKFRLVKRIAAVRNVIHLTWASSCHSTRYAVVLDSYITVFV